jgi:hypothetical protein
LGQLRVQANGDANGFVFAPGLADKTDAKRYRIIKALIPKTYIKADNEKNIEPVDDFAILILNEDMPLKKKVEIASEEQMRRFAKNKIKIEMVGYGFQNGNQRNSPQALIYEPNRSPHRLTSFLYTPEMMIDHYKQYPQSQPWFWNKIEWGAIHNQLLGSPCTADSGSGFFVEENNIRYYIGTNGKGAGMSNCRIDGSVKFYSGGAMSWIPPAYKFLNLIKFAESIVAEEKEKEFIKLEEDRLSSELKAKQEADAKAKAEADAKIKIEEQEKARIEAELATILKRNQDFARKLYAGQKCTKLKSTKTIYNLKFTCIKKNKRLVWNNGI